MSHPRNHAAPRRAALLGLILLAAVPRGLVDAAHATPDSSMTITIYLRPSDPAGLTAFVAAAQTPGSPDFHRFLSRDDFVRRFGATFAGLAVVETFLQTKGLRVDGVFANRMALRASGTVAAINNVFALDIHDATTGLRRGTFSTKQPTIPTALTNFIRGVGGFDTIDPDAPGPTESAQTNNTGITEAFSAADFPSLFKAATGVTAAPGKLTPADYEAIYDVAPLVRSGASGAGETIAIVSATNFSPAIPAQFWNDVHVTRTGQFIVEHVDNSAAEPVPADQSEADLDLEQSGAIAPGATLIDYVAPSTPGGIIDGYEAVASENRADVVSSSIGFPESEFGENPTELLNVTLIPVFRDVFEEFAAQGQTMFVSAGDGGAFQANRDVSGHYLVFPAKGQAPAYTPVQSVNLIAASPLVTAAGGTTLPVTGVDTTVIPTVSVTIATERAWGEDYLPLAALDENRSLTEAGLLLELTFPHGGGGGVSAVWPMPSYQQGVDGMARTAPGQALVELGAKPVALYRPPAGYAGRNLPDLSANADAHTGYLIRTPAGLASNGGGTSFVAPQFAGTLALIEQSLGHRLGQLNPMIYALARHGAAPARDITAGDNWGEAAHAGFDQATGLGAMDGVKLLKGLRSFDDGAGVGACGASPC